VLYVIYFCASIFVGKTASGLLTKHHSRFIDLNRHANTPLHWFPVSQLKSSKQIAFACSIPPESKRRPINGSEQYNFQWKFKVLTGDNVWSHLKVVELAN